MRERYRREGGLSSLILQGFCVGAILVRRDSRQLAKPGVAVEKLACEKAAEKRSRQDAL
jgi:hypothetical protein